MSLYDTNQLVRGPGRPLEGGATVNAPSHIPPELINDFDIYDDRLLSTFRHCLDDLPPVSYTTANGGHWIIQGYKEITAAMRDPETFSSWPASLPADLAKGRGRL